MSFANVYRLPPGITRHLFNPVTARATTEINKAVKFIGHNCACLSTNQCKKHSVNEGLKELQPTNKHWFMKDSPLLPRLVGVPGSVKLTGNAVTPFSAGTLKNEKESGKEKLSLNNLWACYPEKTTPCPVELKNKPGATLSESEQADSGVESLSESESPDNVFITNWDNLGKESFSVQKNPEQTNNLPEESEPGEYNPFRIIVAENAGKFSHKRAWQFSEKFENYHPQFKTIKEEPSSQTPVEETIIRYEKVLIVGEKLKMKNVQNIFAIKRDDLYQEETTRL
ncbi:hypothetical protein L579_2278 [Pantoea sp. AS-PWVM4]|uniref:hypothetical protein n=1 Tax=Pantoea sp. AS-PWVM4 TaxID=1332069 RepID=UPI0003AC95FE|nr:hypothetical protein [Pantoea sp. AS-PWVM4]ERK07833.1 hypothetical protein L579_2278 [Pantoea sp. AS-PWVM4]